MAGDFANRLKNMESHWTTGKDKSPGIPDGEYTCQLKSAELRESQAGKLMIMREHVVLEGEHAGFEQRDFISLETEFGPRQAAQWIELMGYDVPDQVEGIEEVVAAISGDQPCYTARFKKGKDSDFVNVTIKALVDNVATAKPAKPAPAAASKPATKPAAKAAPIAEESDLVGKTVTFNDGTQDYEGTVEAVNANVADVKCGTDVFEVTLDSLTVVETAEDASVLIAFAQSQGIEVDADADYAALVEVLNGYEYKKAELTDEELKLAESIGATIIAPAPAKAAKPAAPKPAAKPAAAKPASKPAPAKSKPASKKK